MEDLIKAFMIFSKYTDAKFPTACEHDVLFVDVNPEIVTMGDKNILYELGFISGNDEQDSYTGNEDKDEEYSPEYEVMFYSYKYGS